MRNQSPFSRLVCLAVGIAVAVVATACAAGGSSAPPSASGKASATTKPKDEAATREIDRAVNDLYLEKKPKEAEDQLLGIIESCGDQCSAAVKARGWMYLGIVRGGGDNDQEGARDAFERAKREDPKVQIDEALSTPATRRTFDAASAD
jgi:hypothetical protein